MCVVRQATPLWNPFVLCGVRRFKWVVPEKLIATKKNGPGKRMGGL